VSPRGVQNNVAVKASPCVLRGNPLINEWLTFSKMGILNKDSPSGGAAAKQACRVWLFSMMSNCCLLLVQIIAIKGHALNQNYNNNTVQLATKRQP
jgi:hypothetical protein